MRIAQVAPLAESVPPRKYGGTERVVSYLTEKLVELGHEVTLFATGDSKTAARVVSTCDRALRDQPDRPGLPLQILLLEQVFSRPGQFDVIHFHTEYAHFPLARRQHTPTVTTLHGRLDLPDLPEFYREYRDAALVSISASQRAPLPEAGWVGTVHHGLPHDLYRLQPEPGEYLAFLGRTSPEKRPDLAIEIARRAGVGLRMAAKIDRVDRPYFERELAARLQGPGIEFLGEVDERAKLELLSRARALLFPIDWPEPFGLVMIEALACGTPVIAFRRGAVPEVIQDGVTGFLVDDVEGAVRAVDRLPQIDRRACRREFERRFTDTVMAGNYLDVYRRIIARG